MCGDSPDESQFRSSLATYMAQVHAADMGGGLVGTVIGLAIAQVVVVVAPHALTATQHAMSIGKDWLEKLAKKLGEYAGKRAAKRIDQIKIPKWVGYALRLGRRMTKKNGGKLNFNPVFKIPY